MRFFWGGAKRLHCTTTLLFPQINRMCYTQEDVECWTSTLLNKRQGLRTLGNDMGTERPHGGGWWQVESRSTVYVGRIQPVCLQKFSGMSVGLRRIPCRSSSALSAKLTAGWAWTWTRQPDNFIQCTLFIEISPRAWQDGNLSIRLSCIRMRWSSFFLRHCRTSSTHRRSFQLLVCWRVNLQ